MSSHHFTNQQVADLLRAAAAAALTLKKANRFQIRAYETASDAIEHLTSEIKDLWEEDKLGLIPGVGENIQAYLEELFKNGKVNHFEQLLKQYPAVVYDLIKVPGIGPKTALNLSELGIKDLEDLRSQIHSGKLVKKGFSAKIAEKIITGLEEYSGRTSRMLLPYASAQAERILEFLKSIPGVEQADPLGSLRRMVSTIGDLDFAAASKDPEKVIKEFIKFPAATEVVNSGENKATLVLNSGIHVDLLVGDPDSYGALLQHFTGSKHHNIHLRTLAEDKGYSLSEYGVRKIASGQVIKCETEEKFYKILGMETPPPEIREDSGEIEASLKHKLPKLVEFQDIKGDLHLHSNFPIERPSHGPGSDSIQDTVKKAEELGYEYVGISDHSPSFTGLTKEQIIDSIAKRTKYIHLLSKSTKSIRVLNGLEIDILGDGGLSVPDEVLKTLDYCIAGIHSGHRGTKEELTTRILKALENPFIDIISHPTGRLINERGSYDADWEEIFKYCAKHHKLLEINGYPNRLDLRDDLVRMALGFGVKFVIDTDAHALSQMDNMPFGVSVARRGWVTKKDIVNTWNWQDFAKWFQLN